MARIGYLVPEWPAQTHAFFAREVSALKELGNDVVLLSTKRPDPTACRHPFAVEAHATTLYLFPPRLRQAGLLLARKRALIPAAVAYVHGLSESSLMERTRVLALLLCAADLAAHAEEQGIEHVHVHSCADAAHLAALCHILSGIPYSLTLHGDLPVYGVDHGRKMAAASFVSTVTYALQQQVMSRVGLPISRTPVISMGVDTQLFQAVERSPVAGQLSLVTVARLHQNKGHFQVLEAVKRVRDEGLDVRYAIAGAGDFRPEIEDKLEKLGLSSCVTMHGSLGEGEVFSLLSRSDTFVLASVGLGEAAPVSVMEAMSTGMPVVCSKIGGTGDMISDGVDGFLVEQNDIDALARTFRMLAQDVSLRAALGARARERACRAFDHRLCAKQVHDAIHGRAPSAREQSGRIAEGEGPLDRPFV